MNQLPALPGIYETRLRMFNHVEFTPFGKIGIRNIAVAELFSASDDRRMREGAKGLIDTAAYRTVMTFKNSFEEDVLSKWTGFSWASEDYEIVARELAEELVRDPKFAQKVKWRLIAERDELFPETDAEPFDPNFQVQRHVLPYDMVEKLAETRSHLIDVYGKRAIDEMEKESLRRTFGRILDYIERIKGEKEYKLYNDLARHLTSLSRICDAVFPYGI